MTTWNLSDPVFEVSEHSSAVAPTTLVDNRFQDDWAALPLTFSRSPADPNHHWRVAAGAYVGSARVRTSAGHRIVRITPKLDADMLFLSDYAFGTERDKLADTHLRTEIAAVRRDPVAVVLAWYLAELHAFAIRWLRRQHIVRDEVLTGRIRGRLVMAEYVMKVGRAQPQLTPCRFFDASLDHTANRVLRAALEAIGSLTAVLPVPEARSAIARSVRRIEPFLHGVTTGRVTPVELHRLNLAGPLRHYGPIIAKSCAVLDGVYLSDQHGVHETNAFMWNSWRMFQEAVRGIIRTLPGVQLVRRTAQAAIRDRSVGPPLKTAKVDPDLIVRCGGRVMTLDAKYKEALPDVPADDAVHVSLGARTIRVHRSDVYQAVSYHHHQQFGGPTGLIYPVVLQPGEPLPGPLRVTGFDPTVWLLCVDVGAHATTNIPYFERALRWVAAQ